MCKWAQADLDEPFDAIDVFRGTSSKDDCAMRCCTRKDCIGFQYDSITMDCSISSKFIMYLDAVVIDLDSTRKWTCNMLGKC